MERPTPTRSEDGRWCSREGATGGDMGHRGGMGGMSGRVLQLAREADDGPDPDRV